eukprot:756600-Hanusia_phi.AAC.1
MEFSLGDAEMSYGVIMTCEDVKMSIHYPDLPPDHSLYIEDDEEAIRRYYSTVPVCSMARSEALDIRSIAQPEQPSSVETKASKMDIITASEVLVTVEEQLNLAKTPSVKANSWATTSSKATPQTPPRAVFQHQLLVKILAKLPGSLVIACSIDAVPEKDRNTYKQQKGRMGVHDTNFPQEEVIVGFIIPGKDANSTKKMLTDQLHLLCGKSGNNKSKDLVKKEHVDGVNVKRSKREEAHDIGRILQQAGIRTLVQKNNGFNNFNASFQPVGEVGMALVFLFDPETLRKYDIVLSKARANSEMRRSRSRGKENFKHVKGPTHSKKRLDFTDFSFQSTQRTMTALPR